MCGIFGLVSNKREILTCSDIKNSLSLLFKLSEKRGRETAGLAIASDFELKIFRRATSPSLMIKSFGFDEFLKSSLKSVSSNNESSKSFASFGHCRLVTNGSQANIDNNHPIRVGELVGVHNGIIINSDKISETKEKSKSMISSEGISSESDTRVLFELIDKQINASECVEDALSKVYKQIIGTASIAFFSEAKPALYLATNNGSLYYSFGEEDGFFIFASERYIVEKFLKNAVINKSQKKLKVYNISPQTGVVVDFNNIIPNVFHFDRLDEYKQLKPSKPYLIIDSPLSRELKRCIKCILPETYPFIYFDDNNVCNYCHKYEKQISYGREDLEKVLERFRSSNGEPDCLVGFSGGRDSSYGLHLLKTELGMTPIAYTYDWGLTTDHSRRNQALICGKLGIEHIVRAANIMKKREYIRSNIYAWLKKPDLGMVPLFFAGDKPFIYYGRQLLKETGLKLTVLCTGNQLEQMEFKVGFCGIDQHLKSNQMLSAYNLRTKVRLAFWYSMQYLKNPAYINKSLLDSAIAFYASFIGNDDALLLYHYISWNEKEIESVLSKKYGWLSDSSYGKNQWRMGDGQTAFTNYVYYTLAGFSEFDNFRSNQVRAGLISREEALKLAVEDNNPRFETLLNFSQLIGFNLEEVLQKINSIPKLY